VPEVLEGKVVLDIEGIDRLYLNLYQPMLQTGGGVATFFKGRRGAKAASTVLMAMAALIRQQLREAGHRHHDRGPCR
jgi:hypothetical protein